MVTGLALQYRRHERKPKPTPRPPKPPSLRFDFPFSLETGRRPARMHSSFTPGHRVRTNSTTSADDTLPAFYQSHSHACSIAASIATSRDFARNVDRAATRHSKPA